MEPQVAASLLKIIIFLPLVLILAYLSIKLGGSRMMGLGSGRIIKIVEKVPLTGKSFLCVALINEKPYVVSCTEDKVEIVMELPIDTLDRLKHTEGSFKENFFANLNQFISRKDKP
jgi:flagellar protein FliO/FliZ